MTTPKTHEERLLTGEVWGHFDGKELEICVAGNGQIAKGVGSKSDEWDAEKFTKAVLKCLWALDKDWWNSRPRFIEPETVQPHKAAVFDYEAMETVDLGTYVSKVVTE